MAAPQATDVALTTDLESPDAIPYFLWDEPLSNRDLRERLVAASPAERNRLLGKILREARDPDVWKYTTPLEVERRWSELSIHLGRRRRFWEFLLGEWRRQGLLGNAPSR